VRAIHPDIAWKIVIIGPIDGIIEDILANPVEIRTVSDDVVVIATLP
jgi:hypothetical protein